MPLVRGQSVDLSRLGSFGQGRPVPEDRAEQSDDHRRRQGQTSEHSRACLRPILRVRSQTTVAVAAAGADLGLGHDELERHDRRDEDRHRKSLVLVPSSDVRFASTIRQRWLQRLA